MKSPPLESPAPAPQVATPVPSIAMPIPLAEAVLGYLAGQPYVQVVNLIRGIEQCQTITVTENAP